MKKPTQTMSLGNQSSNLRYTSAASVNTSLDVRFKNCSYLPRCGTKDLCPIATILAKCILNRRISRTVPSSSSTTKDASCGSISQVSLNIKRQSARKLKSRTATSTANRISNGKPSNLTLSHLIPSLKVYSLEGRF